MNKRVEIKIEKEATPEQKDERAFQQARIDLNYLCKLENLRWFSYKECLYCRNLEIDCECKPEKADIRVVYFIHEHGTTTGCKFLRKRDMAEHTMLYSIARLCWPEESFVLWSGKRGVRILTVMSEERRKEVQQARAALEAMKEASAAGEMVNIEAGLAPMTEVVL